MNSSATLMGIVIVAVAVVMGFYGAFNRLNIEVRQAGGEIVVYKEVTGDYKQVRSEMDELYHELRIEFEIKTNKGYIKYYESPIGSSKGELHSEVGVVLEKEHLKYLGELENDFKVKKVDFKDYIITDFPFRSKSSTIFILKKVYPALEKFSQEKGFSKETPVIEIKDVSRGKITFLKEIGK